MFWSTFQRDKFKRGNQNVHLPFFFLNNWNLNRRYFSKGKFWITHFVLIANSINYCIVSLLIFFFFTSKLNFLILYFFVEITWFLSDFRQNPILTYSLLATTTLFLLVLVFFEIRAQYVAQVDLKLVLLLSKPPKVTGRYLTSGLASIFFFSIVQHFVYLTVNKWTI